MITEHNRSWGPFLLIIIGFKKMKNIHFFRGDNGLSVISPHILLIRWVTNPNDYVRFTQTQNHTKIV